jgi:hypothetical protein
VTVSEFDPRLRWRFLPASDHKDGHGDPAATNVRFRFMSTS